MRALSAVVGLDHHPAGVVNALHPPAAAVNVRNRPAAGRPAPRDDLQSTDDLGEAIAALAARLHAATYELLVMLRDFDERAGWNNGFLSCAHWLHWRTGIDLGASREKVRVSRALASLPRIGAAMQRGAISYAKVRALTRVATPESETSLLDVALAGTAAHVERFVRAWRRIDHVEAAREIEQRNLRRQLSTWIDDDGMFVIRGRLTPEVGAVVQRALEAAADQLYRESAHAPSSGSLAEEVTFGQRRADALGLLAETALAGDFDRGSAADHYQVVLHVDTSEAARDRPGPARGVADDAQTVDGARSFDGVLEVGDAGQRVSEETAKRLACDASVVVMRHDGSGNILDVERKTRTIPSAIRRALTARDRRCAFPGCNSRRCDAHHLEHWADGGPTALDNLALICRRHHRAVHEGGFSIVRQRDGSLRFFRRDGQPLECAPSLPQWQQGSRLDAQGVAARPVAGPLDPVTGRLAAAGINLDATSCALWDGTKVDLAWMIDVLKGNRATT